MEENNLDRLFREAFDKAEETPNPKVWEKVEAQLKNENKIVSIKKTPWLKITSAATVLFFFAIATKIYLAKDDTNAYQVEKTLEPTPHLLTEHAPSKEHTHLTEDNLVSAMLIANPNDEHQSKSTSYTKEEISIPRHRAEYTLEKLEPAMINSISYNIETKEITISEVEPVRPLIEFAEEEETQYASNIKDEYLNNNIITTVLNKITENIDLNEKKNIMFRADEEGSIRIELINSLVKNRFKKRK